MKAQADTLGVAVARPPRQTGESASPARLGLSDVPSDPTRVFVSDEVQSCAPAAPRLPPGDCRECSCPSARCADLKPGRTCCPDCDHRIPTGDAYRQSLCVDCQTRPYSAGRPRCNDCHRDYLNRGTQP